MLRRFMVLASGNRHRFPSAVSCDWIDASYGGTVLPVSAAGFEYIQMMQAGCNDFFKDDHEKLGQYWRWPWFHDDGFADWNGKAEKRHRHAQGQVQPWVEDTQERHGIQPIFVPVEMLGLAGCLAAPSAASLAARILLEKKKRGGEAAASVERLPENCLLAWLAKSQQRRLQPRTASVYSTPSWD